MYMYVHVYCMCSIYKIAAKMIYPTVYYMHMYLYMYM